jgi:hypothetical protein
MTEENIDFQLVPPPPGLHRRKEDWLDFAIPNCGRGNFLYFDRKQQEQQHDSVLLIVDSIPYFRHGSYYVFHQ